MLVKVVVLMVLSLVMLLPVSWLLDLVRERRARSSEARERIERGWGGQQQLRGPVLALPYSREHVDDSTGMRTVHRGTYFLPPEELTWRATLDPEVRSLGIFEALLYRADASAVATFDLETLDGSLDFVHWQDARIVVGLSDPKGIDGTPGIQLAEAPLEIEGPSGFAGFESGFQSPIPPSVYAVPDLHGFTVRVQMSLAGAERLTMVPLGADSRFELEAAWPSPSFVGGHLPRERTLTDESFRARWQVPQLARQLPAYWNHNTSADKLQASFQQEAFGVDLMLPAGGYQRTERAAKYALLFIGLSFVAFFLFEILAGLRLHPIQYLLVAAALVLFYLLMLALTEHFGFLVAYCAAALAVISLITAYSRAVLASGRRAGLVLFELLLLYAYLFVVLAAEDFALLFGATGLFAVLGLVMWLTRGLDWYRVGRRPV